jgi:hypothetical protein
VILLLLAGGAWLLRETYRLRRQLDETRVAQASQTQRERDLERKLADERKRADQLAAELESARVSAKPGQASENKFPEVIAMVLTSAGMREVGAEKPPTITIRPETKRARLQFNVETHDYARYRVGIRPVGGEEIWNRQGLAPRITAAGASFEAVVPADKFSAGDYILTLGGMNGAGEVVDVSKYFFRVRKK